jgi:hypothetical protein
MTAVTRDLRATDTPQRTIVFSSYYDATATTKEQDYGNFTAIVQEDFYFSSTLRMIALGRLRREAANNPYLSGLVEKYPEAVGYALLRSRSSDRGYNLKKEKWWKRLAKRFTSAGDSLRILEAIIKIEMLLAGEIFLVELVDGTVQVIPSEFCGSPGSIGAGVKADGTREVNGIVYDAQGNRVAYRFGKMNAGGVLTYETSELVPAQFVLHIFHKKRVHQGRGLPWLLASLRTARDLYEITRSKTKQIKDANSISGFIEKQGATGALEGMAAPEPDATTGLPAAEKPSDPADRVKTDGPIVLELKPGMFIALEPGEKIHSLMSQYNATDYKELIMLMLHAMSTPVGLPVELWFSGLGDVNYSGYKGLGVQWNGRRQDVIDFLVSAFYEPLYLWRVGKAVVEGELPANPDGDEETIEFVFRRTPILDDEKEGKSNATKLDSGEIDHAAIWEEQGYCAEEIFARRRDTWIKLKIAAGELEEGGDFKQEKVPIGFLLRNELPGETTYPRLPDGTGIGEDAAAAAGDAQAAADTAKTSADTAQQSARDAREALAAIQQLLRRLQVAA